MSKLENIAEILPEGISEATVAEICTLVGEVIEEQVGEQVTQLNAKVNAFLRTKIDVLKEQAMAELQEESETYRNARIFESIKSLVALEIGDEDNASAVAQAKENYSELQEEFNVLMEQSQSLMTDNEELQNTVTVLSGKLRTLEEAVTSIDSEKTLLEEQVKDLEASREEAFNSSEQAVVIGQNMNESSEQEVDGTLNLSNEFLTEEVMKYMPFTKGN